MLKIYVYGYDGTFGFKDRKQSEDGFAGYLTSDAEIVNQVAFCAGILVFRPTVRIKMLFVETLCLHDENVRKGRINGCWEQPSVCYVLAKHGMFNISMNALVHEERTNRKVRDMVIFNHFCGQRGLDRNLKMRKYL